MLECMASESYRSSAPTLFEDCMKSRWSAGDEVDSQMFDIIKGNIYVDVNRIFSSRFTWQQGSIALFRYSLTDNDDNNSSSSTVSIIFPTRTLTASTSRIINAAFLSTRAMAFLV